MNTIIKGSAGRLADTKTFVMAHDDKDHMGDTMVATAMRFKTFSANPVALLSHNRGEMPVGIWTNLRKKDGALLGDLVLANSGTSREADIARALIDQGILRAVSVGFRGIKAEPNDFGGLRYMDADLLECSLVSVPMNPKAVAVVKAMEMTEDEVNKFFKSETAVDKGLEEKLAQQQLLRYEATRKKGIYALINATRASRRSGEL